MVVDGWVGGLVGAWIEWRDADGMMMVMMMKGCNVLI